MRRRLPTEENIEIDPTGYMGDMVRKPEEPKPLCFAEFERHNPFREPDWRWQRGCRLAKQGKEFSSETDDAETGRALRFVRALANCKNDEHHAELARHMPRLYHAYEIHRDGEPTRWLIESRILAGQSLSEIVRATGLSSGVVYLYEAILFAVHDRLEANCRLDKGRSAA